MLWRALANRWWVLRARGTLLCGRISCPSAPVPAFCCLPLVSGDRPQQRTAGAMAWEEREVVRSQQSSYVIHQSLFTIGRRMRLLLLVTVVAEDVSCKLVQNVFEALEMVNW